MANVRDIKRHTRSVKNIRQITRAMQLVATAKMKRAQSRSTAADSYAYGALEILENVTRELRGRKDSFLWRENENSPSVILLITSDRGFCGSLNTALGAAVSKFAKELQVKGEEIRVITAGKKGARLMRRIGMVIEADFHGPSDFFPMGEIGPVARTILSGFQEGKFRRVYIAYTQFINIMSQRPRIRELLPIRKETFASITETDNKMKKFLFKRETGMEEGKEYVYEPSAEKVYEDLIPHLIKVELYKAFLENKASEHSARMLAMKNATDKAGELIGGLALMYNQARQAAITKEIAEISGGAAATAA